MLIQSKFHDFYDTITVYGIDKTCVYQRKTEDLNLDPKLFEPYSSYGNNKGGDLPRLPNEESVNSRANGWDVSIQIHKHLLGFCGKIYPYMQFDASSYNNNGEVPSDVSYDYEAAIEYLYKNNTKLSTHKYASYGSKMSIKTAQGIKEFFEHDWSRYERFFQEHKVPCFAIKHHPHEDHKKILQLNPELKPIRFMKVKGPASAFQEIYMYIAGTLGLPERPMVEIDDKYKQQQHGHDHRYSFRKEPTKRKTT